MNRALRFLGLLLGLAILAWLVAQADIAALLAVFPQIGWGFLAILAARTLTIALDAAAWHCLLPPGERPGFATVLRLRWICESINTILPVAQIGGDFVRARLLQRRLATPAQGAASVVVDFGVSILAQIVFTILGFVLLAWLSLDVGWWPVVLSLAAMAAFWVLSWEVLFGGRLLAAAERGAMRLGWRRLAMSLRSLDEALTLMAGSRASLALALGLHLANALAHAFELWLTLYLMRAPVGFAEATLLESLSLTARSAAFLIPSGWGAQEATLVALAGVAGLSGETALALGLVKRVREFAIGLPGLVAWAIAEHRPPARPPR